MNISEQDRQRIVDWARSHSEIRKVYLYGSRARGTNRPDSDIDLAIVMKATNDESQIVWMDWIRKYRASPDLHLNHPVDLKWYEKGAGLERVGTGVERDGILLYPAGGEDEQ